jgi:hypothetical protein
MAIMGVGSLRQARASSASEQRSAVRTVPAVVAVGMRAGPAVQAPAAVALMAAVSTEGKPGVAVGSTEGKPAVAPEVPAVASEVPAAKPAVTVAPGAVTAPVAPSARMAVKTLPRAKVTAAAAVKATGRVTGGKSATVTATAMPWVKKTERARRSRADRCYHR